MVKKVNYLDEEIRATQLKLSKHEPGSEEREKLLNDLNKLYEMKANETKTKVMIWDPIMKNGGQLLTFGGMVLAYGKWYKDGLKFETTGTVCSSWVRNLTSKMLPKMFS